MLSPVIIYLNKALLFTELSRKSCW